MTEQSPMLFIPKREILEMLKSAFDEGWQGYQDLRDPTAEQILEDWCEEYKERRLKETGMTPVMDVQMATQVGFDFNDGVIQEPLTPAPEFVPPPEWSTNNLSVAGGGSLSTGNTEVAITNNDGITWGSVTVNTHTDGWTINDGPQDSEQERSAN